MVNSSSAWCVFTSTSLTPCQRQFWWMVGKYQSKRDRRDCNMQLSSKVMWTKRTFKSRQRLAVLIAIETHNTMFFHIHPATVILPYHYTAASFYIFVHHIFACLRTQHLAMLSQRPVENVAEGEAPLSVKRLTGCKRKHPRVQRFGEMADETPTWWNKSSHFCVYSSTCPGEPAS